MHRPGRPCVLATILVLAGLALLALPDWGGSRGNLDGAVTLRLERSTFLLGEDVSFTERNGRSEALFLPCADPWVVHRSIGGEWYRVEYHECDATLRPLEPGAMYEGVWHSRIPDTAPGLAAAEPGYYRIDMIAFSCHDGFDRCERILTSAFFWLR